MLGGMDERREAELPWAHASLGWRIGLAVLFGAVALLMGWTLFPSRGAAWGALIAVFWGALEVLVVVFPNTLQRWSRHQPLFRAVLTFGLVLYVLLVITTIITSASVAIAVALALIVGLASITRRRRTPEASTPRGRRHS